MWFYKFCCSKWSTPGHSYQTIQSKILCPQSCEGFDIQFLRAKHLSSSYLLNDYFEASFSKNMNLLLHCCLQPHPASDIIIVIILIIIFIMSVTIYWWRMSMSNYCAWGTCSVSTQKRFLIDASFKRRLEPVHSTFSRLWCRLFGYSVSDKFGLHRKWKVEMVD